MTDTSGHGRPYQDDDQLRHTLTIQEISARLSEAGVPRSERQIKRYCETGFLDAKKVPGPSGAQWFVAPATLPKLIGDLQQWQVQRAGHGQPRPDMSEHVTPEKPRDVAPGTAGHGRPEQAMSDKQAPTPSITAHSANDSALGRRSPAEDYAPTETKAGEPNTSGDVVHLEREVEGLREDREFLRDQIKVKDGQIASLLERDRETNILIRGLQEMLTPLLAGPRRQQDPEDSRPGGDTGG